MDAGRGLGVRLPWVMTGRQRTDGGPGDKDPGTRHMALRGWAWTKQTTESLVKGTAGRATALVPLCCCTHGETEAWRKRGP